jgi:hypothetical protein
MEPSPMNSADADAPIMLSIPVSLGELADRISILEIKSRRVKDPRRRDNVLRELALLNRALAQSGCRLAESELDELRRVNGRLWQLEDRIRRLDREGVAGDEYLEVAREIHRRNDIRHGLKRTISLNAGSLLVEEKEYGA